MSGANTSASAAFRVIVNDGADTVVDSAVKSGVGTLAEPNWTQRTDIDLSAFANKTVIIKFVVTATDTGSNLTRAKAWVDSISVGPPSDSADTTAPTVNVTAPGNATTVSGTVDVTATASDAAGVKKVEFYVDGALASTDSASPFVFTWNTAGVANGSHSLMAKAYDAANNIGTDNDTSVTVSNSTGGTTTVSFPSIAADDGYVKANADGSSPAVGTITTPAVGKGSDGKFNRSFFSFDTASLPDTATIVRASLKVTLSSASGDPWADPAGNTLVIDLKNGTFGTAGTETTDFTAAATADAVGELIKFTTGAQGSTDFNAAGLTAINKTGHTQARVRFTLNPVTSATSSSPRAAAPPSPSSTSSGGTQLSGLVSGVRGRCFFFRQVVEHGVSSSLHSSPETRNFLFFLEARSRGNLPGYACAAFQPGGQAVPLS